MDRKHVVSRKEFAQMNKKIKQFKEINAFFEATGFEKRTDIADFFIFKFEELTSNSAMQMPPYQKDFFQVSLITDVHNSQIHINTQNQALAPDTLYFLSPSHIFSWRRDFELKGFNLYFKASLLNFYKGDIEKDFSFFSIIDKNILSLDTKQAQSIAQDLLKIHTEFHAVNPYRTQIVQSLLLSFLFKIKSIVEAEAKLQPLQNRKQVLVAEFRNAVKNCYIKHKKVKQYADYMAVSANYLNDTIKEITGKTAKQLIHERILTEAKNLLHYSNADIAEIAYSLGFDEPTHFIRFFKSQTQITPKIYRQQIQ